VKAFENTSVFPASFHLSKPKLAILKLFDLKRIKFSAIFMRRTKEG